MESRSGLAFGTLMVRIHTLDLTPVAPRSYNPVAIQLLIKDTTGNAYVSLTVGRNSILNFPAKIRTGMCRALLCGDW